MDKRLQCRTCHLAFDPHQSIGQWDCRVHANRTMELDANNELAYACCTLTKLDESRVVRDAYLFLSPLDLHGCVRADHFATLEPEGESRQVDDIALLIPAKQKDVPISIPSNARLSPPRGQHEWSWHDISECKRTGEKLEVTLDVVGPDGRAITKTIDIFPRLHDEVARAYRTESFQRTHAGDLRARLLQYRPNLGRTRPGPLATPEARMVYEKLYQGSGLLLDDTEFFGQYLLLADPDRIKVPIVIVRLAAPSIDPAFRERVLKQQEARNSFYYWSIQ
jgi:hypothetical protein